MKFPKNSRLFLVHQTFYLLCNRLGSMTFTTTYYGQAGAPPSCHTAQGGNFGIGFLKNKYMKFPKNSRLFLVHRNPINHLILSKTLNLLCNHIGSMTLTATLPRPGRCSSFLPHRSRRHFWYQISKKSVYEIS